MYTKQLESRRQRLGISISQLSRTTGVSLSTLARLLKYNSRGVSCDAVLAVADTLGVKVWGEKP